MNVAGPLSAFCSNSHGFLGGRQRDENGCAPVGTNFQGATDLLHSFLHSAKTKAIVPMKSSFKPGLYIGSDRSRDGGIHTVFLLTQG
jgi:hypothetical protein